MSNVTIVTGAAGALGSAVVARLRAQGHKVAGIDPHAAGLSALGPHVLPLTFDTNDAAAWADALGRITATLGAPTGLVLVAGGWRGGGPLHERVDDGVWASMVSLNLDSVHRALRAVLPGMVERRGGSVVVIGARPAVRPELGAGAAEYTATKSAAVALAQVVAAEVLPFGVRVNAVLPSMIDTPANRRAMPDADSTKWVAPDSLGGVVAFLLSDDSKDISGAALPVYGRS